MRGGFFSATRNLIHYRCFNQMKKILLTSALLSISYSACAQVELVRLLINGTMLGVRAAKKNAEGKPQTEKADPYAQSVTYRAQHLALKRTPPNKLHGKGSAEITRLEALLQQCYATMTTDSMATVMPDNVLATIKTTQAQVSELRPAWNLDSYHDEYNFYLGEDARRQRVARAATVPITK